MKIDCEKCEFYKTVPFKHCKLSKCPHDEYTIKDYNPLVRSVNKLISSLIDNGEYVKYSEDIENVLYRVEQYESEK